MDFDSLPQTAMALVWAFLGCTEDCQAFRCSYRAASQFADGRIQCLNATGADDAETPADDAEIIDALQVCVRAVRD